MARPASRARPRRTPPPIAAATACAGGQPPRREARRPRPRRRAPRSAPACRAGGTSSPRSRRSPRPVSAASTPEPDDAADPALVGRHPERRVALGVLGPPEALARRQRQVLDRHVVLEVDPRPPRRLDVPERLATAPPASSACGTRPRRRESRAPRPPPPPPRPRRRAPPPSRTPRRRAGDRQPRHGVRRRHEGRDPLVPDRPRRPDGRSGAAPGSSRPATARQSTAIRSTAAPRRTLISRRPVRPRVATDLAAGQHPPRPGRRRRARPRVDDRRHLDPGRRQVGRRAPAVVAGGEDRRPPPAPPPSG